MTDPTLAELSAAAPKHDLAALLRTSRDQRQNITTRSIASGKLDRALRARFEAGDLIEREKVAALVAAAEVASKRWWWRTPATGTLCVFCGASAHFDLGIDGIVHLPGCEHDALRAALAAMTEAGVR